MHKKISISFLTLLSVASIFVACEDSSIMDVNSDNIDKLPDVDVISIASQSSAEITSQLSSIETISSEQENGSSQDITNLSQKTDGSSEIQGSSTDIFDKSSEAEISSEIQASSETETKSSTVASSIALSSIAASSAAASSVAASSTTSVGVDCSGTPDWKNEAYNWSGSPEYVKHNNKQYSHTNWVDEEPGTGSGWTLVGDCQ